MSFTVSFGTTVPVGQHITATATDPNNNTSEFSECIAVDVAVGGIAAFPDIEHPASKATDMSGGSSFPYAALAGGMAAAVAVLAAGGWYARRRWLG